MLWRAILGRDTYSPRGLVEQRANISIRYLLDHKILGNGPLLASWEREITETRGEWKETIANIKYQVKIEDRPGSIFGKMTFETKYQGQTYWNVHTLVSQPVNLGGSRYYFRCALCGRRVKAIYYGFKGWACRHCCQLVYKASREHRNPFALQSAAETCREKADHLIETGHPRLAKRMEKKAAIQEIAFQQGFNEFLGRHFLKSCS